MVSRRDWQSGDLHSHTCRWWTADNTSESIPPSNTPPTSRRTSVHLSSLYNPHTGTAVVACHSTTIHQPPIPPHTTLIANELVYPAAALYPNASTNGSCSGACMAILNVAVSVMGRNSAWSLFRIIRSPAMVGRNVSWRGGGCTAVGTTFICFVFCWFHVVELIAHTVVWITHSYEVAKWSMNYHKCTPNLAKLHGWPSNVHSCMISANE